MTTLALPSSNIILNSRMIKALAWLGMHVLVMAWHVLIDHDFGCVRLSWLEMYEHVMA